MAETIMGASGQNLWHVTSAGAGLVTGSLAVDVSVADYISIIGSPNYNLPVIGSFYLSNGSINVDVNVSDYVSIVGSPNYSLPVIGSQAISNLPSQYPGSQYITNFPNPQNILGSVEVSNTTRAVTQSTTPWTVEGSAIQKGTWTVSNTGSVEVSNLQNPMPIIGSVAIPASVTITANNLDIRDLTSASDYISIIGSPNYSLPVTGSQEISNFPTQYPGSVYVTNAVDVTTTTADYMSIIGSPNYKLPVIGSVEISNNINVDITTDDYISIVGSPNYNLPIIGSIAIPASVTISSTDLDIRDLTSASDSISVVGSVQISSSASNIGITQQTTPWIIEGSAIQKGNWNVGSILSALPAGTNLLGSAIIADGGNTITVDGTVTANQGGTWNVGTLTSITNAVDVNTTTADYISIIGSPNYSLPIIGSMAIPSSVTVTATNLDIRDLTSASDSVSVVGSVQISSSAANLGVTQQTTPWITEGSAIQKGTWNIGTLTSITNAVDVNTTTADYISIVGSPNYNLPVVGSVQLSASTNIIGAVKKDVVNYTKVQKYVALGDTNETTVWDPTGGTKFVITDIFVSATAAGTCTLKDGTAGTTFLIASLAANGGFVTNLQTPIQSATADNNLTATASAATQYITVCGYEV